MPLTTEKIPGFDEIKFEAASMLGQLYEKLVSNVTIIEYSHNSIFEMYIAFVTWL